MKIIVSGSNGFLGSNLCNILSHKHQILALSRSNNNLNLCNNIDFIKCDFDNFYNYFEDIKKFKPEIFIHCAWLGANNYNDLNSMIQFESAYKSFKMLEFLKNAEIKKFIGIGSGSEYGKHFTQVNENDIFNPYNLYGKSKLYFREISQKYCEINDIDFSWVFPMYVYGYNDIPTRFIPSLISKCLRNENIELDSCISLIDYLFVEDFCLGIESIVDFNLSGCYNISSGQTYETKFISEKIKELTNYEKQIIYNPLKNRVGFQNYFHSSSKKLQNQSCWKPKTNFMDGILKTIHFYKNILNVQSL